jgi:GT2 family glycosyltransferase
MPYRGAFNFARMNNAAVRRHADGAGYLLFLNNDVEAVAPGWLGRLRSLAGREEVGAAAPLLLYGNDRVQHGGVLVGFSGAADHAMKLVDAFAPDGARNPGYNCNLISVRDYSAVTAACMMLRREVFTRFGGFDERFAVGFNDTDLCLRLRGAGLKILYDGHTALYHHESATRIGNNELAHPNDDALLRTRWARYFRDGDPFYSPLLTDGGTDHLLRSDTGWKGRLGVRTVTVAPRAVAACEPGSTRRAVTPERERASAAK